MTGNERPFCWRDSNHCPPTRTDLPWRAPGIQVATLPCNERGQRAKKIHKDKEKTCPQCPQEDPLLTFTCVLGLQKFLKSKKWFLTESVSICLWIYPNVTQLTCEFQSFRVQMCQIRGLCNETLPSSFICFWFLLLDCINVPTMHCSFVTSPVLIQLHLHHHALPPTFPTEEGMFFCVAVSPVTS